MSYITRTIEPVLRELLEAGKSILLLGARQTGKTTLLKNLNLPSLFYTLLDPTTRLHFEKYPQMLAQELAAFKHLQAINLPLVIIDEIQKIPALMDVIQLLIDNREAQFILTGSSVRKLRRHPQFNFLPGRLINLHLDAFSISEMLRPLPDIENLLAYGSLPGIYLQENQAIKEKELGSYVTNYLTEEVRGEALVRQMAIFSQFLELAALESGRPLNINRISQDLGVSRHTIAEYLQILEDCLIFERIDPLIKTATRRRLSKSAKFIFFDMGTRRMAARDSVTQTPKIYGEWFEQWVGLELLHLLRITAPQAKLRYWQDHTGPEIDYVIEHEQKFLPIEVKWTQTPTLKDARYFSKFIEEYDCITPGIIICRCVKPLLLTDHVLALPWQEITQLGQFLIR